MGAPGVDERPSATSRDSALYRLGSWLARQARALRRSLARMVNVGLGVGVGGRAGAGPGGRRGAVGDPLDPIQAERPARLPEVQAALRGRYGSATRLTYGGQRSVTLYSALPIRQQQRQPPPLGAATAATGVEGSRVVGVVLVSQSTYRLLQALYDVRLRIFEAVVISLAVAAILTAVVSATIARPIRRLRAEAVALIDRRGRLAGRLRGSTRRDEIGDLSRSLAELTRRLDEHLRFVEAFSADVSHELKNPLASIRTIADLLTSVDDPAERTRFLGMLRRDVDRLERLIVGVREIAVIDTQLEREATVLVDVRALAHNVADAHRLRATRPVRIAIDAPAPVWVRTAPDRLAQVLDNLLDNAIGFSPDEGTVTVAIHAERNERLDTGSADSECHVRVQDEGPGIPAAHLARIFERFFTWRPTEEDARRHHTGLGLAIARTIVESYGGSLTAANGDQRGACFHLRLPAQHPGDGKT